MLAHQRRRMVAASPQCSNHLRRARRRWRDIAKPDREIAQPAFVADAVDRAAEQARVEFRFAPGKKLDERDVVETVAHREIRLGARLREFVPRADQLAIVAAVDAIADQRAQFQRNRAFVFDREVGNTAPRVELVRRDDGARGTDVDALAATAAVIGLRRIHRQRQVGVDFAEKKVRPASRVSSSVCLPRQPRPAFSASSTSITGALSVNTR